MSHADLPQWQQNLIVRLERDLDRGLTASDLGCVAWNPAAETLTVQSAPLLSELRSRNLISNVFRSRNPTQHHSR